MFVCISERLRGRASGSVRVSASSFKSIRICNSLIHKQKFCLKMAIEDVLQKVRESTQDPTKKYHMFIANKPVSGNRKFLEVTNKYTGEVGMILRLFFLVNPRRVDTLVSPLLRICYCSSVLVCVPVVNALSIFGLEIYWCNAIRHFHLK